MVSPLHPQLATPRVLYKMLTAALARISILEKTRDISYRDGFKAASQACIVRGCERKFASHENVLRHLKESSTPQHQVVAIILGQTSCLQCDKDFKRPTKLKPMNSTVMRKPIRRK